MNNIPARKIERLTYISLWILIFMLYSLDVLRGRLTDSLSPVDSGVVIGMVRGMLPFLVLFLLHNTLLVRRLLLTNRFKRYIILTTLLILAVWGWQCLNFSIKISQHPIPPELKAFIPKHPRPLLPLPVWLDLIYDLLIVGTNLAVALIFQRFIDRLENEKLLKTNAENQLAYLKAQINPHFYMNMLNNIHGMIEINPEKAQQMVIDMSGLMRYMLYESSNNRIALSAEISFMRNYLSLMRERYPENKVKITAQLPTEAECSGIMVPPLLFLVFIENAFKHGISYRDESFVSISIEVSSKRIIFNCINSVHASASEESRQGIGLTNVESRLKLIYGSDANLESRQDDHVYIVSLSIPAHDTENTNN